jgi:hypothetical protein
MPVGARGAGKATAAKKAAPRRTTASAQGPGVDLVSVRMTALNYARSLFGSVDVGVADPVTSASKLVTQAKRIERYILGQDSGEDV